MQLLIDPCGGVRCVYDEALDLTFLGPLSIRRASHVEPDAEGHVHPGGGGMSLHTTVRQPPTAKRMWTPISPGGIYRPTDGGR